MLPEPKKIEALARFLCKLRDDDPNRLRPGNLAFHSSFNYKKYRNGEFDHLFDNDPSYKSDGNWGGDKAMYAWRDYVYDAVEVRKHLKLTPHE